VFKLLENNIGKCCPYCQFVIKSNSDSVRCPVCKTPHHKECWEENRGCTTFACTGKLHKNSEVFRGTFRWPTGAIYIGEILGGMRHGFGLMKYPNGSTYEGAYANDKRSGFGVMTYPDGRQLQGQWKDDRFEKN
jgi:hypothetical protein